MKNTILNNLVKFDKTIILFLFNVYNLTISHDATTNKVCRFWSCSFYTDIPGHIRHVDGTPTRTGAWSVSRSSISDDLKKKVKNVSLEGNEWISRFVFRLRETGFLLLVAETIKSGFFPISISISISIFISTLISVSISIFIRSIVWIKKKKDIRHYERKFTIMIQRWDNQMFDFHHVNTRVTPKNENFFQAEAKRKYNEIRGGGQIVAE